MQLILLHAHQWEMKKQKKKEYYCDEIYMLCTVTLTDHTTGTPCYPGCACQYGLREALDFSVFQSPACTTSLGVPSKSL